MKGRKRKPTVLKVIEGNPGRRPLNEREPRPPSSLPTCPSHLSPTARTEWKRLTRVLNEIGLLTEIDRTVLAAYCQSHGRWVEAGRKLAETPPLLKTPAGYVQVSPSMTIANKQLELMAMFMAEIGLTPSSRCRIAVDVPAGPRPRETGLEAKCVR